MKKKSVDRYDTPTGIAATMVRAVQIMNVHAIADFAVGGGSLLRAASNRWPNAKLIATDICPATISAIRRAQPDWHAGVVNFLNPKSLSQCRPLRRPGIANLVLLNPPFSCRGSKKVYFGSNRLGCSTAMAFVLRALEFLSCDGELVAIIPEGSLHSERDQAAWCLIRQQFGVSLIRRYKRRAFVGCSVQTRIVRLTRLHSPVARTPAAMAPMPRASKMIDPPVEVIRGWVQMYSVEALLGRTAAPLIHTTCLRENAVLAGKLKVSRERARLRGTFVLLPRVGEPNREKFAILQASSNVALSDCVIAVRCPDRKAADAILHALLARFAVVKSCYSGTCAKYTTLRRVVEMIGRLGFRAVSVKPDDVEPRDTDRAHYGRVRTADISLKLAYPRYVSSSFEAS
jgi:hypothetical protein